MLELFPLLHELLLVHTCWQEPRLQLHQAAPRGLRNVQAQRSHTKTRVHCGLPQRGHTIGLPLAFFLHLYFFYKLGHSSLPNSLLHLRKGIKYKNMSSLFQILSSCPLQQALFLQPLPAAFPKAKWVERPAWHISQSVWSGFFSEKGLGPREQNLIV